MSGPKTQVYMFRTVFFEGQGPRSVTYEQDLSITHATTALVLFRKREKLFHFSLKELEEHLKN